MKKSTLALRGLVFALTLLLGAGTAGAVKFTIDGINYDTSQAGTGKVGVAKYTITNGDSAFYKGDITIPPQVTYNDVTYTVALVKANAFINCRELTHLYLPETCVKFENNCFRGCEALENYPIPETATDLGTGFIWGCKSITEAFVPAAISKPFISNQFAGSGVKKLTFRASETPFKMHVGAFGSESSMYPPIEELVLERAIDASAYAYNQQPFHNYGSLKKVTFGGEVTAVDANFLIGCTGLETVVFEEGNKITSIGGSAFSGCTSLQSITLPAGITAVGESVFYNCKSLSDISFEGDITSIGGNAFGNTLALKSFNFPATLTSIGVSAFAQTGIEGELALPENLRTIGTTAFANAPAITSISIPASVTTIGNAAFAPMAGLAAISVNEGNASFKVVDGVLYDFDGKRLLVSAHQGEIGEALDNATVESIDNYGLALAPFKTVNIPAIKNIGNNAFYKSAITEFNIKNGVELGINVFTESALETLTIEEGVKEIPQSLCYKCAALREVNLPASLIAIMQNAFGECPALESMELGKSVNYMEAGAVPATIKSLRVLNVDTPVLGPNVFTAAQSEVECKVAVGSVDAYKADAQWGLLNIVGDETISGQGAVLGCPAGLYFATKDGRLMYKNEEGEIIDTEFQVGEHAFNLGSYKNRIYVAVAGHNFRYEDIAAQANGGDGEVFYVNKTDDQFYRVTVLNNVGYKAFEDPFSLTIVPEDEKIYIADRNVGIHEMNVDAVGLYGSQPFFCNNDQLPYYGNPWIYGAIGAGFQYRKSDIIDTNGTTLEGVYWMAKKFNGFGIFRFDKSRIYESGQGSSHADKCLPVILDNVQMTTFYIDEENGYLYAFAQKDNSDAKCQPGLYRIPMATVAAKQGDLRLSDGVLVDDSPILLEGSGDEITGVTQITGDGEHIYWAYISPESETASIVPDMKAYEPENPLHKTGIKMISAKPEDPAVAPEISYAVEGIAAYGLTISNFVAPEPPAPEPIPGDVDGNEVVNGSDVTALYNFLLNGAEVGGKADVDNNGTVNGSDVTALYNILLNN